MLEQSFQQVRIQDRPIVSTNVPEANQNFPFTIQIADTDQLLRQAIAIRAAAYGRHVPELGVKFQTVEELDRAEGVTVLVVESKIDRSPIGTVRIQTNQFRPLLIEQAVSLSGHGGLVLAELSRLAVCQESVGRVARMALFNAIYQFSVQNSIDKLVIGARRPLDRMYRGLLFKDLFPGLGPVPLAYANGIPHHILYLDIPTAAENWKAANHPMHEFLTEANHPDIQICPRRVSLH